MARLIGIDIPDNKHIYIGLTYIYGIGKARSKEILDELNISLQKKVKELTSNEILKIKEYIEKNNILIEGNLRSKVRLDIKRLLDINCYRGIRHRNNLPVRGQNTKSNARTRKGPRKTIANKKKVKSKK
ncbi:30S ribosomal protein S13 [symbiont of Argiope bruennichi]|uniref:30S ribosomal protein S13 n=1 Tax=symbiont of Argiope bruennichi TaxID=2810479 RepID=UPI003DA59F16